MPYMLQPEAFIADLQGHGNQSGTKNKEDSERNKEFDNRRSGTSTLTMTAGDEGNRYLVSWNGPNDPENPMNWSTKKRISHVALVSISTLIS